MKKITVKLTLTDELARPTFEKDEKGNPFLYGYTISGLFKDACGGLRHSKDGRYAKSSQLTSCRTVIDHTVFVRPRRISIALSGPVGHRKLFVRGVNVYGEHPTIDGETIPVGSQLVFDVVLLEPSFEDYVLEWLDYGRWWWMATWRRRGDKLYTWEIANA